MIVYEQYSLQALWPDYIFWDQTDGLYTLSIRL